ncbi:MAG: arylamine N-acetyltransferase, partial [Opitutus sp.]
EIDLASIERKLVAGRRGGYCFEQNALLGAALQALGFAVTPLMARVRWQIPAEIATGLTHMLLRVEAEGDSFIGDVGFGSMSLSRPLHLALDEAQDVSLEPRRLINRIRPDGRGGEDRSLLVHQAKIGDDWGDVYQFTLEPSPPIDFALGNWFTSCHPQSRFVQNLVAARIEDDHRYTIFNREFTIRGRDGRAIKREIESPDELLAILADHFHLAFPAGTRFGSAGVAWPV